MRDIPFGSILSWLFESPLKVPDPIHQLIAILAGLSFGILVVGTLLLLGKFFIHWAIEIVSTRLKRDSLDGSYYDPSSPFYRGIDRRGRQRRLPGVRRRGESS